MNEHITPEEAKASLGIATHLQGMLIPQAQPEGSQNGSQAPETAPGQEQPQESQKDPMTEMQGLKDEIMTELQTMREDIKMMAKGDAKDERSEINDLKRQIEDALNESD